jgi:hypothetical protein
MASIQQVKFLLSHKFEPHAPGHLKRRSLSLKHFPFLWSLRFAINSARRDLPLECLLEPSVSFILPDCMR